MSYLETKELSKIHHTPVRETIRFHGHPVVRAEHATTIEITTEEHLTENGDCIVGVGASMGCAGLQAETKAALRREEAKVTLRIRVREMVFELKARGDPRLELTHPHDMVIRKSPFVSDRTLAVSANAAAVDLPREMVRTLTDPKVSGFLEIEVV